MPIKSDPRRLPRRNHFHEGSGFLFVATQGGRPVGSIAASTPAAVVRVRAGAVRRWAEGETLVTVCARAACSRATLFRWRSRFEADGLSGLIDRERRGDRSDLVPELPRAILVVRLLSYWNSRRNAAEFGRRGIAVSHGQVDRLLARAGTNRTSVAGCPDRVTSGRARTSSGTSTSRVRSTQSGTRPATSCASKRWVERSTNCRRTGRYRAPPL